MRPAYFYFIVSLGFPASLRAQSLEDRIAKVPSGTVRMSFAARPGVCGNGENNISTVRENSEWESGCDTGPVWVSLRLQDHQVIEVRTYVGGRWRESKTALDLGTVPSEAAAHYFLNLAGRPDEFEGDPVLPATLADSVTVWPALLKLARNTRIPEERRKTAVFWLSQAAEAAAGLALDSIVSDPHGTREIRKQAVFAMSQRDPDEAVPRLIHIVKTSPDPELRKTALFWLGQSEDPRAVDLFEQILQ